MFSFQEGEYMLQIDDAGSGSLIGGVVIGAVRVENLDYYYEIIPVKYFTSPYFEEKKYMDYCIKIIKNILKHFNVNKSEEIQICQGYIFDKARVYLKNNGYNFISTKIEEPLQSVVENTYYEYSIKLGIPYEYLKYTKYPFHLHRLLKWVFCDFEKRKKICKTGWKSWNKYSGVKISKYTDFFYAGNMLCLKCGSKIYAPCKIKVMSYATNKNYRVYIHENCNAIKQIE